MTSRRAALAAVVLAAMLAWPAVVRAQGTPVGAPDDVAPTAPVTLDGAVLFSVRGTSSFPAEARAEAIRDRVAAAAVDPAVTPESLTAVDRDGVVRLAAGDHPLMSIVDADAALEGVTRGDLAASHLMRLRQAIVSYRAARTPAALRQAASKSVTATALLLVAIAALAWFWRWFGRLLQRRIQARIRTVGIQSFEVMRADRIRAALHSAVLAVRIVVYAVLGFVYAGFVLAQWPATRGAARGVTGLALEPLRTMGNGVVANIPRLSFLVILFLVVRFILRLIRLFFEAVGRGTVQLGGFDAEWAQPTYKIVRVGVIAFGLIVAYPYIPGSQSEAFKGVSLFIGIVFSLGSSSAISNVIAGYMMTYRRAFKVGDRVKIGDAVGDVIEMRLQVTHLRSFKNEEIVIPNSQILAGDVMNYSSLAREHGLLLHTEVGIGYEISWRQVEAMLLTAAARTPGLGTAPAPFVLVKRLGDFAITYELNAPCGEIKTMNALYTALHQNILDVFNEHGVQIMTPAYEGDPAEPKIVSPADWRAGRPADPREATTS